MNLLVLQKFDLKHYQGFIDAQYTASLVVSFIWDPYHLYLDITPLFGFIVSDLVVCGTILQASTMVEHPSVDLVL